MFVEAPTCRRAILLRHFGEDPPESCGNCDNCLEPPATIDATEVARKLLSAVYRTGQSFGFGHVQKVLTGAADDRVMQRGHDQLSVFGIVGSDEARLLQPLSRALQARGALVSTEHGGLKLGGDARAITSPYAGTALIAAAHLGHVQIVRRLITAKAPLDHVNNLGWTALMEAIVLGDGGASHTATVEALVEAGADVNLPDRDGKTPLRHARTRGYAQIGRILERAGAR